MTVKLANVIYHVTTDQDFAAKFQLNPVSAITEARFNLEEDVQQALINVLQDTVRVKNLLTSLDPGPDGPNWA